MLRQAQQKLTQAGWSDVVWLQHDAAPLPFADGQFQVVACLEALEFMPDPRAALSELLRVARPGGLVVLTNRIGRDARLMPGKVFSRAKLGELLRAANARAVDIRPWQVDYDLVTALKVNPPLRRWSAWTGRPTCDVQAVVRTSPCCQQDDPALLSCTHCGWRLRLDDGIWQNASGPRS